MARFVRQKISQDFVRDFEAAMTEKELDSVNPSAPLASNGLTYPTQQHINKHAHFTDRHLVGTQPLFQRS